MSRWTDQWRDFVRETSYKNSLAKRKISNDEFWRSFGIYDQAIMLSGYPGEALAKISSFIAPKTTLLDIGAGTGAFAVPLSKITSKTVAVDPSQYQLQLLSEKAKKEGLANIVTIEKEWKDVEPSEIACNIDYALAAYSLFDEDIEGFLKKMIDIAKKGIFIVFRASGNDTLSEFAFGTRPNADCICLAQILKDMGYQFNEMLFTRNYSLPIDLVFQQYRFCKKSKDELLGHLNREGRLQERDGGKWATFQATDGLLYMIC
jgi:SAM-dependent methyltransferase